MYLVCILCWAIFIGDSIIMRCFHDEIKPKQVLKAITVYVWLGSLVLGLSTAISVIITEVL